MASRDRDPEGGRYESIAEIARGGMGRVVEARDRVLDRPVAIKESLDGDGEHLARFEREARLTARLQHPAIVPVYDAGRWPSGQPFYAMKLVGGRTLERSIAEARDLDERIALLPAVIAVADAIAYAHSRRVIHRDLKPGNVLVGEFGETLVVDWGLAKELEAGERAAAAPDEPPASPGLTRKGAVVGTPAYMPPEQACGDPIDARADVYALGAILYHLLAGVPPIEAAGSEDVLERVILDGATPLAERQPGVPRDLLAIVDKAMARDPARRYANGSELAADLKRFQRGQLVAAHVYSRGQLLARWLRRHRGVVTVAAIAALALAVLGATSLARIARERAEAEAQRRDARSRTMALLEEQGRQELGSGRGARAAELLGEAYRMGSESSSLRFLLARAMASVDARVGALAGEARVHAVGFTRDGALIIGADEAGRLRSWDAATLEPIASVAAHDGAILDLDVSPDGALTVTAGRDGAARLWSAAGARVRSLDGHGAAVARARFSPDGARLVTTTEEGAVAVWDPGTGARLASLGDHQGSVRALAFSLDGAWFATGADDATVRIRATRDGAPVAELETLLSSISSISISPDGSSVAIAGDAQQGFPGSAPAVDVELWRAPGWRRTPLRGHVGPITAAAFSPDGAVLATASADQTVRVWSARVEAPVPIATLRGAAPLTAVAFTPDGTRVVTGALDGTVQLWEPRGGTLLATFAPSRSPGAAIRRIATSPDGARLVALSREDAVVWDARGGLLALATTVPAGGYAPAQVFSPDGARIVVPRAGEAIDVWDLVRGRIALTTAPWTRIWSASFSPDGSRIVTGARSGKVTLWDAHDGAAIAGLAGHEAAVFVAAYAPSGARIFTKDAAHHLRLWDSLGHLVAAPEEPRAIYCPPRFDASGARFVTVAAPRPGQGVVSVRDTADGRVIATLELDDDPRCASLGPDGTRVLLVAANRPPRLARLDGSDAVTFGDKGSGVAELSPDGTLVVTGRDGKAVLWDAATGTQVRELLGHGDALVFARFSPDGALLATGSLDRTVRIWDPRAGRSLLELTPTAGFLVDAVFAPDGSALLTTDASGNALVWRTWLETRPPDEIVARLAAR